MGHFRSTIIGNFVSNVMSSVGHDTVKINYLGDWGTQFGLLNVGLEIKNVTDDEIAANPIKVLYEAYVSANKEVATNPALHLRAREIFSQMEKGTFESKERWERFRQFTVDELRQTYLRLGITFDEYQWESMFGAKDIALVIQELEDAKILIDQPDGTFSLNTLTNFTNYFNFRQESC
jgi:arginyl-tRNA synthetase